MNLTERASEWLSKKYPYSWAVNERVLSIQGLPRLMAYFASELLAEQWVAVSERLPDKAGTYQVTCHFVNGNLGTRSKSKVQELYFMNGIWRVSEYQSWTDYLGIVTAWRPLPEPYEERK